MARPVARLVLTDEERNTLAAWSRLSAGPNRMVERARIILLAADGLPAREIARRLRTRLARVSKWRNRFSRNRLTGLQDAPRPGKPNTYDEQTEKRMLALWIPIRRMATVSGMDACWRKRWETSVPITCGGFCASIASSCREGAVGVSLQIRNSVPKPLTWWVCI